MEAMHITSGIAIISPTAVVIRAKLMSVASFDGSTPVRWLPAILPKAAIIPRTVPCRPSIGAVFTTVLTHDIW